MKLYLFILLFSTNVFALPILNESVGTNSIYTIYPDHVDANLYYLSPNFMSVALDEDETPLFNYTEYKVRYKTFANIQMILRVDNYEAELNKAKTEILRHNPKARFALIPFLKSQMEFDDNFKGMVFNHSCSHIAGEYSAEQSCMMNLTNFGMKVFKNTIHKRLTLLFKFYYEVSGVNRTAENSFIDSTRKFQIAGRVGGDKLINYPELFTDWKGQIIKF
jgi:hypothetical protein